MQALHAWRADGAVFDDNNLVSHAGLVPLLELAERSGLSRLLDEHVRFVDERVKSGAANPTPRLTSIIAGMAVGADSIDDLDVIRAGGMKQVFSGVYAAATLGILLREFTHGHTRQLSAVLRKHLVALAEQTAVLDGIGERAFVDIDSLLRPVYGHAKQGASFGRTKIAGKAILRRGLSPLAVTISTETAAPVLAGVRLRAGRAGSAKGAATMVTEGINTAKAAGARAEDILVRGDCAYCSGKVVAAVVNAEARFSFAIARNPAVDAAIAGISDEQYMPVHYPGAVTDPDTGELISDAQVAEVEFTAFTGTRYEITGWLVVRRVLDANTQDPLFPVWRFRHPVPQGSLDDSQISGHLRDGLAGGDHELYRLRLVLGGELPTGAPHLDRLLVDQCPLWSLSTRSGTVQGAVPGQSAGQRAQPSRRRDLDRQGDRPGDAPRGTGVPAR